MRRRPRWQPADRLPPRSRAADRYELEMGFSRGLFTGWLGGIDNQRLVHARFGKKRGVFLGTVARVRGDRVSVRAEAPLKAGDGVVFDAGRPDQPEEGGRVYSVDALAGGLASLGFGHGVDLSKVHAGDRLWKTNDPELDRRLRQSFAGDAPRFQRPIGLEVHGHAGIPLTLIARDGLGHVARVDSAVPLAAGGPAPADVRISLRAARAAGRQPVQTGRFAQRARRRGHAARQRTQPAAPRGRGGVGTPARAARAAGRSRTPRPFPPATPAAPGSAAGQARLNVLIRSLAQLDAVLAGGHRDDLLRFRRPEAVPGSGAARARRRRGGCRRRRAADHLGRAAADFQDRRGMGAQAGALRGGRRLSGAQLRSSALFRRRAVHRGFLAQRRQPAHGRILHGPLRAGTPHRLLRSQRQPTGEPAGERAAGVVRGDDPSAHADVSHGALRVLRVPLDRHGLPQLRPAVRQARGEIARPRRAGTSAAGGRRLPQHGFQRARADRRGKRGTPAGARGAAFPAGVRQRVARARWRG